MGVGSTTPAVYTACQMFFRLTRRVTSLINTGASRFERSFLCAQRKLISAEVKVLTVDANRISDVE
jgi:hypothetical protein